MTGDGGGGSRISVTTVAFSHQSPLFVSSDVSVMLFSTMSNDVVTWKSVVNRLLQVAVMVRVTSAYLAKAGTGVSDTDEPAVPNECGSVDERVVQVSGPPELVNVQSMSVKVS